MTKELLKKWRALGSIEFPKLLLLEYRNLKLNEVELILLLQIIEFQKENNYFPTPELISTRMTISPLECSQILGKLVRSGYVELISTDENHMLSEVYSLDPLWDRLLELFILKENQMNKQKEGIKEENVFVIFEREFGRPLSVYECETISLWLDTDKNTPELVLHALKEAVISGKLSINYIDRILFEWNKNNIRTVAQAIEKSKRYRRNQSATTSSVNQTATIPKTVPSYNWVD